MRIDAPIITGSFSLNGDTFNDLGAYTTTGSNTFIGDQSIVGAVSASALTGSINYTNLTGVPTLVSGSEQVVGILSSLNQFTASNSTTNTFTSSATARLDSIETISASNIGRLNSLEQKTGSLATTGSNTFYGTQTITGSLYISSDLIVQGSSSLQNITASAVSIGTNIVNLNTANPAIRYAGLVIGDSGSIGSSGSFFYDSVQDEMIFVHRGANTTVTSSVVLMGPQTYDNIGNETYPTNNRIQKGTGNEHLVDSNISDNGTTIILNSNAEITGSLKVNAATSYFTGSVGIGTTSVSNRLDTAGGNVQFSSANVNVVAKDTGTGYAVFVAQAQNAGGGILDVGAHGSTAGGIVSGAPANAGIISSRNAHELHFGVGGASKMMINTSGNVGIGTTNPAAKLALSGSIAQMLSLDTSIANGPYQVFRKNGSDEFYIGNRGAVSGGGGVGYDLYSTGDLRLFSGGTALLSLTGSYVGIGTTTPSGKLHVVVSETQSQTTGFKVVGDTNGKSVILGANTSYAWIQSHGSAPLYINELGNNIVLNLSGGNVGIGTNNPASKFHVYGGLTTLRAASSGQYDLIRLEDNAGSAYGSIGVNSSGWMYLSNTTGGTQHIVLNTAGKVGIGTTDLSGTAKFLVNGSIGFAGDTEKYLYMPDVGQGTGSIYMQAGFGSAAAGGAVKLHGHNATTYAGGDVEVGMSGKGDFLINAFIGGSRRVTVKNGGNVGIGVTNPSENLQVAGNTRFDSTTMLGSNVGLLQMAMDGSRIYSYPYTHVHIKTSILKGGDTMIAFNLRGYTYSPDIIDTDVGFYLYQPVNYVYGVQTRHKGVAVTVGMYYSSDNYVCFYINGMGTYGGCVINWINTSLIQWGARVYILSQTRVNTDAAQY